QDEALRDDGSVRADASSDLERGELPAHGRRQAPAEGQKLVRIGRRGHHRGIAENGGQATRRHRAGTLGNEGADLGTTAEDRELRSGWRDGFTESRFEGFGRDPRRTSQGTQRISRELGYGN